MLLVRVKSHTATTCPRCQAVHGPHNYFKRLYSLYVNTPRRVTSLTVHSILLVRGDHCVGDRFYVLTPFLISTPVFTVICIGYNVWGIC